MTVLTITQTGSPITSTALNERRCRHALAQMKAAGFLVAKQPRLRNEHASKLA